eukprot:GFYU01003430.1.p1 GENE.GFYU01003430.1~~GFYU01003430.1.p1  ORF type:complete len:191 (-),score=50.22 GFYU01003430.1:173-745(-)
MSYTVEHVDTRQKTAQEVSGEAIAYGSKVGLATLAATSALGLLGSRISPTFQRLRVPQRVGVVWSLTLFGGMAATESYLMNYAKVTDVENRHSTAAEAAKKAGIKPEDLSLRKALVQYRYQVVGGVWLASIGTAVALAYGNKNLKMSQKLIHARVIAQAATVGSLLVTGALAMADEEDDDPEHPHRKSYR